MNSCLLVCRERSIVRGDEDRIMIRPSSPRRPLFAYRAIWNIGRIAGSLRLNAGGLDHLAPFLGFFGDQPAELGRRSRQRRAAKVSETGLHLRVFESRVDLLGACRWLQRTNVRRGLTSLPPRLTRPTNEEPTCTADKSASKTWEVRPCCQLRLEAAARAAKDVARSKAT
jgi:hypothetical protein